MATDIENDTENVTPIRDLRKVHADEVDAALTNPEEVASREAHPSGYNFKEVPTGTEEAPEDSPQRQCVTAFLVIVEEDGSAVADPNYSQGLQTHRPANFYDMISACEIVKADVQASKIAQISLQLQMQTAQALQRQAADQQLGNQVMQKLHGPKG